MADISEALKEFALGNSQFSANVYKQLRTSNSHDNLLVCPLSAEIVLALVHAGARGKTAEQLSNGLHLPQSSEKIKQIFKELGAILQSNEHYTFSSANKVYVKDGLKIKDEFKNTAVKDFLAEIQNIDFENKHPAASEINKWVDEKTNDKIKNIIDPDELDDNVFAILVNAMYFHGTWIHRFKKSDTENKLFYRNNNDQVNVDMMKQTDYFNYYENSSLDAKLLMMPYMGDLVTMTIVLPNRKDGLTALEAHIDEVFVTPNYCLERVYVEVPKFKLETEIQFKPILKALGIVNAFQNYADFSGIIHNERLKISKVIQKAFIDVEEEGTTAAAATAVYMIRESALCQEPLPKVFVADHPFIFYLKINDVIFFIGRCNSPTY